MAKELRHKDARWQIDMNASNANYDPCILAVLMDLRDELKALNNVFRCHRVLNIPNQLEAVAKMAKRANANAAKRRKAKK